MNTLTLTTPLTIEAAAEDAKPIKVTMLLYSGGVMQPQGMGDVLVDLSGVKLPTEVPILASHSQDIKAVVGQGTPQSKDGRLYVEGVLLPVTEAAKEIIALAKQGYKFQASVGISYKSAKVVDSGEKITANGRTFTAARSGLVYVPKSELYEASLVVLGGDRNTSVSIAASKGTSKVEANTPPPVHHAQAPNTSNTSIEAARNQERQRIAEIDSACSDMPGVDPLRLNAIRANAIQAGTSIDEFNGELLALLRSARSTPPAIAGVGPAIHTGVHHAEPESMLEAALLTRAGFEGLAEKELGARVMESSRQLAGASFVDLCRASMQLEGRTIPTTSRDAMIRASVSSTYSLPTALGNAMNKVLLQTYRDSPATWRSIAAIRSASNFKEHTSIRPSFVGELEEVAPDGELHHGSLGESTIPWRVGTFGKLIGIPRTDIVNDDLGFLDEVAPAMSRASLRKLADLFYSTLLAAGSSYFNAGLGNSGTSPLGVVTLGTGIQAMRDQKDDKNNNLDIQPATLLVPTDLEATGKAALESEFTERVATNTSGEVDAVRPTGNPQRKAVSLEVEARLNNTSKYPNASDTGWYLFGTPSDVPMIVGFLDGQQAPTTEFFGLDTDPKKLVVSYRVYHDFGVALGDYRAAYKSSGAS